MNTMNIKRRLALMSPAFVGVLIILLFCGYIKLGGHKKGEESIVTSATLVEAVSISELSTSQFTYNGVAEYKKDDKVVCYIRYDAKVKAGIDMKSMDFEVDHKNKIVVPILPDIQINTDAIDENSIKFLPENAEIELAEVLSMCKEDACKEATESKELMISAKDNLKAIIEALTYPLIDSQGYKLEWSEVDEVDKVD